MARALRLEASEDDVLRGRASPVVAARGPVRVAAVEPRPDVASAPPLDWASGPAETEVEPESEEVSADATPMACGPIRGQASTNAVAPARATRSSRHPLPLLKSMTWSLFLILPGRRPSVNHLAHSFLTVLQFTPNTFPI